MPGDVPLYITDGPVPRDYVVPNSGELLPLQVEGVIDGTSAASSFYAVLQVLDPNGRSMGKYISSAIAAGASADVTWFPNQIAQASSSSSGSGPAVLFDNTATGTVATIGTGANGVAQTHKDLLIVTSLRTNEAITNTGDCALEINGDTGHRKQDRLRVVNTTVSGFTTDSGAGGVACMAASGANADAGTFGRSVNYIPDYTSSKQPNVIGIEGSAPASAAFTSWFFVGTIGAWTGMTGPITQLTVVPNLGGGGQFVAGSRVTVYGLG